MKILRRFFLSDIAFPHLCAIKKVEEKMVESRLRWNRLCPSSSSVLLLLLSCIERGGGKAADDSTFEIEGRKKIGKEREDGLGGLRGGKRFTNWQKENLKWELGETSVLLKEISSFSSLRCSAFVNWDGGEKEGEERTKKELFLVLPFPIYQSKRKEEERGQKEDLRVLPPLLLREQQQQATHHKISGGPSAFTKTKNIIVWIRNFSFRWNISFL